VGKTVLFRFALHEGIGGGWRVISPAGLVPADPAIDPDSQSVTDV
jgi:hypothetical protein